MIEKAAERIRQMEQYFDKLLELEYTDPDTLREDASVKAILCTLIRYYESGQWMQDYELDEKGLLPRNLKRGVLAQDSVYDFLERIRDTGENL